ncbi:MAG: tRNA pseudouridine(55) synthase TruB [Dongiaceae bacterium]
MTEQPKQFKRIKKKINGWLVIDKPVGMGSTQVVGAIKRLTSAAKVGHAGTLDPLASGLLPIALGEATKTTSYVMDGDKIYDFTVTWGQERDTDDSEGKVVKESANRPTQAEIEKFIPQFIGEVWQIPCTYSAIKKDGMRAYDIAREGGEVKLDPRQVFIDSLTILSMDEAAGATIFRCHCGRGTYVRAIARDLGRLLGCFGYVSALRRTKAGPFTESHAISLDSLEKIGDNTPTGVNPLNSFLLPVDAALDDIPAFPIDRNQEAHLRQGRTITVPISPEAEPILCRAVSQGRTVALVEMSGNRLQPVRVLNF